MSGLLAGKVWQSALKADLKPIAAVLADIGNDDGANIYPSVPYLCWLLGRSERAVRSWLSQLRELTILEVVGETTDLRRLGAGYTAEYLLHPDRLPKRGAWDRSKSNPYRQKSPANGAGVRRKALQTTTQSPANHDIKALQNTASEEGRTLIQDPLVDPLVQPRTVEVSYVNLKHGHRIPHFWCGEFFCVKADKFFEHQQRAHAGGEEMTEAEWNTWYAEKDKEWGDIDIPDREPRGVMFWLAGQMSADLGGWAKGA